MYSDDSFIPKLLSWVNLKVGVLPRIILGYRVRFLGTGCGIACDFRAISKGNWGLDRLPNILWLRLAAAGAINFEYGECPRI